MIRYETFHYWLSETQNSAHSPTTTYDALLAAPDQLQVIETGITSHTPEDVLTSTQLEALQAADRTVLGYVNATVTDHNRAYWQNHWVRPADQSSENPDAGTPSDTAPDWFANPLGQATGPNSEVFGPIVDFRNENWQDIVIADAVAVVRAGYSGIFLDDVGRYFIENIDRPISELARDIMAFVNRIADAIHAVDPDAVLFVNGGGYLRWNADVDTGNTFEWWEYLSNVDGFVLEYVDAAATSAPNWADITGYYLDMVNFLYIVDDDLTTPAGLDTAISNGVVVDIVPDPNYSTPPEPGALTPPTETGVQQQVVDVGGIRHTIIQGTAGDDLIDLSDLDMPAIIYGLDGDDTIIGTGFDDLIFAGSGHDNVDAGAGNDVILGAAGNDTLNGSAGADTISGGSGGDFLSGGDGPDLLSGGALPDSFVFDL